LNSFLRSEGITMWIVVSLAISKFLHKYMTAGVYFSNFPC
jgi:hypothetical protein